MAIRIAFIGLSASSGWAKGAHFPYLKQTSKYQITAICNSSKESSEAAIKAYGLPASTKAYGSPEELAEAADSFDLAVCSVRVDKHYAVIRPLVAKGKDCYVEWPLGKNLAEARQLHDLVTKSGNPRTVVGLQARRSPVVNKVKHLIAEGAIGKVLSSSVLAAASNLGQIDNEVAGTFLNDGKIGGNMLTIHFGHMIDYVLYGLSAKLSQLSAIVSTLRPNIQIKLSDGSLIDKTRETPDQILLQGRLDNGAVLSMHERGGPPFKDTPGLVWRIYGETGELQVTSSGAFLQIGYDDMTIKLHKHEADTVETIDWAPKDEFESFPMAARNPARLYEAFADGKAADYADWEEAVARHHLLECIVKSSESGAWVSL